MSNVIKTWSVNQLTCYPTAEGQTDVAFQAAWTITGTDGTFFASAYSTVPLTYVAGSPYTPYADITSDMAVGWVKGALGADTVAAYEASMDSQIEAQINPTQVVLPLPWVPAPTPVVA